MLRKTWEVEPRTDDRWAVQRTETRPADSVHDRKADAIVRARELAEKARLGQVRVKNGEGKIEKEWTYPRSSDPRRTPG